jgi:putative hemolysin
MDVATAVSLLLLVLASALFSGSEAALFSLNQVQIRQIEAGADRSSRTVRALLRNPQRLLNSLLVGNTLANTGLSAVVTSFALLRFGEKGIQVAIPVAAGVILLLCEILPKTIAVNFPRAIARSASLPLVGILPVLGPFTFGITALARWALRLLGLPDTGEGLIRRVTRSELRAALEEIDEETGMSRIENRLVQNILAFSRTTAEEVMTPRIDITAAPVTAAAGELHDLIARTKHSRVPLYDRTVDSIVGYLPSRAFLLNPVPRFTELIRPVLFVPEKAQIDKIFHDLRKGRWRIAIVVNEYGETVGLITQEDLIEEVVGELFDEYEQSEEEIVELSDDLYEVRGRTSLQDLGERLGVELPQEQAVTVNGFLCSLHGGFPRPGTVLRWNDLSFEILEVSRHRIARVRVAGEKGRGDA